MASLEFLLGTTIGCGLVGAMLSQFLYGLSLAQAVYYFWVYPDDPRHLKGLVACWLLLDTVKEAIALQVLFEDLIANHANLESIAHLSIAYGAQNVLGWILVFSVQCFYINNMKHILRYHKRRRLIIGVAIVLAILTLLAGSAIIDYAIYYKGRFNKMSLVALAPPGIIILTDVYITFVLCYTLYAAKSGLRSPALVNRLIKYSADRGIILCMVQLVALATYIYDIHSGSTNITAVVYFAEVNVYCNTGMAAEHAQARPGIAERPVLCEIMPMTRPQGPVDSNNTSSGSDDTALATPRTPPSAAIARQSMIRRIDNLWR
ncbi:uncharacterized protein B0H18DRAFT_1116255 [Fomitopsis serialis]|uniref:uncharacterized protein n=1 Tax=Fomitopsis serialis TaxID=139415 RepID=UPI002008814A|nr:uncharacterized protein B0H18DRAFT_1116255 [Neoantrodia serialis]KAH9931443.1 hypothetical protein B0H18DRAFT_1116255 [Neoantrodia serialis]